MNDVSNAAQYRGTPELGGNTGFVLNPDVRPLQQLAAYTVMYNKSLFKQRQKDADEKIKALSELTAYDAAQGEGKDKEEVMKRVEALRQKGADFAAQKWKSPNEKTQAYFAFQKEIADDIKTINSATARKQKLDLYNAAIDKDVKLTVPEREERKKVAKRLFDETDINTMFNIPDYDMKTPTAPKALTEKVNTIKKDKDGNAVIIKSEEGFAFEANAKNGYLFGNELNFPETLPENASQEQKDAFAQQGLAFGKTKLGGWVDAANFGAAALSDPNYKKTETTTDINVVGAAPVTRLTDQVDVEKIKASNPLYGGVVNMADQYNKALAEKIYKLENKVYTDTVTGEVIEFAGGSDTVEGLKALFIDVTKPLSPAQLANLAIFEQALPTLVEKKYIETNDANERLNTNLDFKVQWKNAETARINALKPDGSGNGSGKQETVISQPAILFGEHINRLKGEFKRNNGKDIIVPFKNVDEKTRVATKLKDGEYVIYKQDGSYVITTDQKGQDNAKVLSVGTIDNLAQGFIDAVKTIDLDGSTDKDGTMAEGFQVKSEAFFNQTFGTASGSTIWNNWGKGSVAPTKTVSTATIKSKVGTQGFEGYTEKELIEYYKSQGYEIK